MTTDAIKVMQQTTLTMATPDFMAAHPELHHYTNLDGLHGIYESNSLRATHYLDLNNSTEVRLLQQPLSDALNARFTEIVRERQRDSFRIRRAVQDTGGLQKVARSLADDLVASMYRVTFDPSSDWACEPYIASFCTHAAATAAYERDNGLLSQWRGYGGSGGYCIVLDTPALSAMLGAEFDAHYYVHMNIAPVNYAVQGAAVAQLFPDLMARCEHFVSYLIDNPGQPPAGDDGIVPFIVGATLYKHQGFREECEVRIAAMPGTAKMLKQVQAEHPEIGAPSVKPNESAKRRGRKRRFISLLDNTKQRLPINRIIVGPSLNQSENIARAKQLVGSDVTVTASVTPFID